MVPMQAGLAQPAPRAMLRTHAGPALVIQPRPVPPLWLLVLITVSGTLAMHILVPALPTVARDLKAGIATTQLAISLYLIGLAVGQLVYGVLADRFGRRPVLFAGLALYCLASAAAAAAGSIHALLAARLLQALGGCAGLALGRAIVRDVAETEAAASRLAILNLVVSIGPGLAPILGGALSLWFGWRSIFVFLALAGGATLLAALLLLPETRRPGAARPIGGIARDYARLLVSPAFLGYAIGGACATTSMYAFMAVSPYVYAEQLGRPAGELGVYYSLIILGVSLGSFIASRLVRRLGIPRLMLSASILGVLGALTLLAVVLNGQASVVTITVPVLLFTIGAGTASPLALTRAISVNPQTIASAAGLYGFGQMALGALCTAASGLGSNPMLSAALILTAASLLALTAFLIALRTGS